MNEYVVRVHNMADYESFKNNLTKEEVINRLKIIKRGCLPDYSFSGDELDFECYQNQMIMKKAIELLEQQGENK